MHGAFDGGFVKVHGVMHRHRASLITRRFARGDPLGAVLAFGRRIA